MSGNGAEGILACLAGGPLLLGAGLHALRKKRLIEDTPTARVNSAAVGVVELAGHAEPCKLFTAPVSTLPCCWWRCRVQRRGQKGGWRTVREVSSGGFFYLKDDTGRVLVNPSDADIYVDSITFHSSGWGPEEKLNKALSSWGIAAGRGRSLRVIEEYVPEHGPLFVWGELKTLTSHVGDRQQRYQLFLQTLKSDPAKMAAADANKDGAVDPQEWDAYRLSAEQDFLKQELARKSETGPENRLIVGAPRGRPYLIALSQEKIHKVLGRWALWGTLGGIALSALGVFLAQRQGMPRGLIAALLSAGLLIGFFIPKAKSLKRRFTL